MALTVHVALRAERDAGFLGGDLEYDPSITFATTWGTERRSRRAPPLRAGGAPVPLGALALPAPAAVVGDEAVWLKFFAKSAYAGVPELDADAAARVVHEIGAGTVRCALSDLLEAARTNRPLELPVSDTLLLTTVFGNLQQARDAGAAERQPLTDAEMQRLAELAAYKGTVVVTAQLPTFEAHGAPVASALRAAAAREDAQTLLYNSDRMIAALQGAQTLLLEQYVANWVDVPPSAEAADAAAAPPPPPPRFRVGSRCPEAGGLHVPFYVNEYGAVPLVAMAQDRLEAREPALRERMTAAEVAHYGPRRDAALMADQLLVWAARRAGLTGEQFVAAITAQQTQSPSDPTLSAAFLDAYTAIADMGTFVANRVQYTADMRFVNKALLPTVELLRAPSKPSKPNKPNTPATKALAALAPLARHGAVQRVTQRLAAAQRLSGAHAARVLQAPLRSPLGRAHWRLFVGGHYDKAGGVGLGVTEAGGAAQTPASPPPPPPPLPSIEIEDMFCTAVYYQVKDGDCDDSGATAVHVLRGLSQLAATVSAAEAPALHAAARVLARTKASDAISVVNGGYMKSDADELMTPEELRALHDLPKIGDALDQRTRAGGHCHGLLFPDAVLAAALARGGVTDAPLGRDFAAHERRMPILVLEGTAPCESLVLPAGEVARAVMATAGDAAAYEARAAAQHAYIKSLVGAAPGKSDAAASAGAPDSVGGAAAAAAPAQPPKSPLLQKSAVRSLAYYTAPQDRDRRVSRFYLSTTMICSADLYKLHPLLGQLSFVNVRERSRGADFGSLLRMPFDGDASAVALVPTYDGISRADWDAVVRPVLACVQRQMPLASLDHVAPADAAVARTRLGQVLPPQVVLAASTAVSGHASVTAALDRHAVGLERRRRGELAAPAGAGVRTRAPLLSGLSPTAAPAHVDLETRQNVVCFYYQPAALDDAPLMRSVVAHLDAQKLAGAIVDYTFVRDQPFLRDADVVTLAVTLPPV